ncbi:hypothetical protein D3C81_1515150 [compost metagenome]
MLFEAWHALAGERRHIWQQRRGGSHGDGGNLPGPDVWRQPHWVVEHDLHLPANQIRVGRRRAAIRNMNHRHPDELLELFAHQVRHGANAYRSEAVLRLVRFQPGNQRAGIGHAQGVVDGQHVGRRADEAGIGEVLRRVVGQLRIQRHAYRVRARRDHASRVAIGNGPRHVARPERAAGPAAIVDHHRLPEFALQQRLDRTNHEVGTAAGRKWHHHGDGLRRPGFRMGGDGARRNSDRQHGAAGPAR